MKLVSSLKKGFYFQCSCCGECCSAKVEGLVFIFPPDIERFTHQFECSQEELAANYLSIVEYTFHIWDKNLEDTGKKRVMPTLVLKAEPGKDCIFLAQKESQKICTIHANRPFQCECYPRWSMLMTQETNLHETMKSCPGFLLKSNKAKSQGPNSECKYYSPEDIINWVKHERQLEYEYYLADEIE